MNIKNDKYPEFLLDVKTNIVTLTLPCVSQEVEDDYLVLVFNWVPLNKEVQILSERLHVDLVPVEEGYVEEINDWDEIPVEDSSMSVVQAHDTGCFVHRLPLDTLPDSLKP